MKQKLNNVWLYIINLPETRLSKTSPYHTYCVAVGAGYLDHTPVLDWFADQMEDLMKGNIMYCGIQHQMIRVKLGAVANLADRPEKLFTLKTSLLGTYGRVASWATDISTDVLPDCNRCFQKMLTNIQNNNGDREPALDGRCGWCCQWDLKSNSRSMKRILPPEDYPTRTDMGAPPPPVGQEVGIRYLVPIEQTFNMLISSVEFAAYHVKKGLWTKAMMNAYLRTCAVAGRVRDGVWTSVKGNIGEDANENETDNEIDDGYVPITRSAKEFIPKS